MKKFTLYLFLLISFITVFTITTSANPLYKNFSNIVINNEKGFNNISWQKEKDVDTYVVSNDQGEILYEGKKNHFNLKSIGKNEVQSIFLSGYSKGLFGEKVKMHKTNVVTYSDSENPGFKNVIVNADNVKLEWDQGVGNPEYSIYKDETLVTKTTVPEFTDNNISTLKEIVYKVVYDTNIPDEEGKQYSYIITVQPSIINNDNTITPMAIDGGDNTKFRFMTFIQESKASLSILGSQFSFDTYNGDGRGFGYSYGDNRTTTPKYKTLQEVDITFSSKSANYYENVGTTYRYKNQTTELVCTKRASMSNSSFANYMWNTTSVAFNVYLSAANPCESMAPPFDAVGTVTLYKSSGTVTGTTNLYMEHDGFPAYEVYRKTGTLSPRTIYNYNPNTSGGDLWDLYPGLDKAVNVTN